MMNLNKFNKMNKLDLDYCNLINDVLNNGNKKQDRTGIGTVSIPGKSISHDMRDGFPILTTKYIYFKGVVGELLWFLSGKTNLKFLKNRDINIWDGDAKKDLESKTLIDLKEWLSLNDYYFGPIYGKQWRRFGNQEYDQIEAIINGLKENPFSRRHLVSSWNPNELKDMVLPPCHWGFQFIVDEIKGEKNLSLVFNMRSSDLFLGLPFNISSYGLLLCIISELVNMKPYRLVGNLGDAHIYLNHINPIKKQLKRKNLGFDLPQLEIHCNLKEIWDNTKFFLEDQPYNNKMDINSFSLENYNYHSQIRAKLNN